MNDPVSRGKRLASRYAALQLAAAAAVAVGAAVMSGGPAARAALAGGVVVAAGNLLFGWLLFAPGAASAPRIARAMWAGQGLKWLWVVTAVWLALGVMTLSPLPFLLGMLAAQAGFWVGMAFFR